MENTKQNCQHETELLAMFISKNNFDVTLKQSTEQHQSFQLWREI